MTIWTIGGPQAQGTTPAAGVYEPAFQAGYVQYAGPGNTFAANTNFIFGTELPNPSGTNAPGLLLGSGVPQAWLITDEAETPTTPGINLGIAAGETQPSGTENGGLLELYGGASFGGTGGAVNIQGGTALNGTGGTTTIAGGNSTNGLPGPLFLIGGQTGTQGANVELIMTELNGIPGAIIFRVNSTQLYEFAATGAIFIGASGAGLAGQPLVSGGAAASPEWQEGYTGTVGTMTFASGILKTVT